MLRITHLLVFVALFFAELSAKGKGGRVHVKGYYRKDGTYVQPHYRSAPDGNFNNNWSTKGNVNPYTGEVGTKTSPANSAGYNNDSEIPYSTSYPNQDAESNNRSENNRSKNVERAQYWRANGYSFDPYLMTAFSMDQKVKDIERSKYLASRGHHFDPDIYSAYSMDQAIKSKVKTESRKRIEKEESPIAREDSAVNTALHNVQMLKQQANDRHRWWVSDSIAMEEGCVGSEASSEVCKEYFGKVKNTKPGNRIAEDPKTTISHSMVSNSDWSIQYSTEAAKSKKEEIVFSNLEECRQWGNNKAEEFRSNSYQFKFECKNENEIYKKSVW